MIIIDISQPLSDALSGFPIDTKYSETFVARIGFGASVNVSKITLSSHSGTHADAPYHYDENGSRIGEVSLEPFIGPARVVDARSDSPFVLPKNIASQLKGTPPRVLLRLHDTIDPNQWNPNFRALSPDVINLLNAHGVKLIGVDTPSIDQETSKDLPAHMAVNRFDMRILENLMLSHVQPGDYELIALPLKFENLDGSPVRAILRTLI
jgi:arylformamidase